DDACGRYFADGVVEDVGDEEVAAGINGHGVGESELGTSGGPAVTAEAKGAVAGEGADEARGRHLADGVVDDIGNEKVAAGINRQPLGKSELGAGGGPAVAAEARGAVPSAGADEARERHLADDVVAIGNEDV